MNFKTTYILFGILAGALGLLLLVQLFGKKPGEETEGNLVLPTLNEAGDKKVKTEDIARVEVEQFRPKSQKFVFERGEEGWRLREPRVRLQTNSVDELIREVMGVKHLDEEADMTKDLHIYALDEPAVVV
ncbi:MAG TPA: hypothetical protein VKI65_07610, partial [Gemmataceae bacterium]|nr:hypothetical protein [Gemmataceae bacterium]